MSGGGATDRADSGRGDPLEAVRAAVEALLERALGQMEGAPRMVEACRYAVLGPDGRGGGKRLRPCLVLLCYRAAGGGDDEEAAAAAIAVEFVHTFSLVHDDLPCMDDDDLRRGRPTLHVAMGEGVAVLAGDLLLAEAMTTLARDVPDRQLAAQLVRELGEATARMVSGQAWDTGGGLPEGLDDLGRLRLIHEHKTGALIRASCRMGGLVGVARAMEMGSRQAASLPHPSGRVLEALTRYGEALGLLFQVTDDLLDVEGSAEAMGKGTGKDAAAGKLTYPGVLGVQGARAEAQRLRAEAESAAGELGQRGGALVALAGVVAERVR